jgi:hypothetical protein
MTGRPLGYSKSLKFGMYVRGTAVYGVLPNSLWRKGFSTVYLSCITNRLILASFHADTRLTGMDQGRHSVALICYIHNQGVGKEATINYLKV